MRIVIDGKTTIECSEVRVESPVTSVDGITEESTLYVVATSEGLIMDLEEITNRCNGSNSEITRTFSNTYDELVDLLR